MIKPVLFFSLFTTLGSLLSCASVPNTNDSGEQLNSSELDQDIHVLTSAQDSQEQIGDGFCADDIYSQYLLKTYNEQSSAKMKSTARSQKAKRQQERSKRSAATFYAQQVLSGPVVPYFGGIPVVANERVEEWVNFFKNEGRPTFIKWLIRAESYREMVNPILLQEGLPPELLYLAMIESGFSNTAASSRSATGTWQFMKGTAQLYRLRIDHWIDERRDPIKSTVAAARYLRDLYAQFGDWYLAMAAYNAGPGKVRSAIRRSKSRDFWEIARTPFLKPETKNYVPKVLAALNLSANAHAHGFAISRNSEHLLPTSTIVLDQPVSLRELSNLLEVPLQTLRYWNPEIVQDVTPPNRLGRQYDLRLADHLIPQFGLVRSRLSHLEITDVQLHKIKSGDTLSSLARRYKVSIARIKTANPSLNPKHLRIGREIAIPVPGVIQQRRASAELPNSKQGIAQ